jgi:hypothetical protein
MGIGEKDRRAQRVGRARVGAGADDVRVMRHRDRPLCSDPKFQTWYGYRSTMGPVSSYRRRVRPEAAPRATDEADKSGSVFFLADRWQRCLGRERTSLG